MLESIIGRRYASLIYTCCFISYKRKMSARDHIIQVCKLLNACLSVMVMFLKNSYNLLMYYSIPLDVGTLCKGPRVARNYPTEIESFCGIFGGGSERILLRLSGLKSSAILLLLGAREKQIGLV